MKLSSVVLLSVNLVAASQVAANAADTASFLQDALTPSSASSAAPSPAEYRTPAPKAARPQPKKRASSRAYVAMTPSMDGVKMRPFVPGRFLPSEADIQAKKDGLAPFGGAEAAAQQSISFVPGNADPVLSGRVSVGNDISSALAPAAAYAMSRPMNPDYMHKVQSIVQKVKQAAKQYSATHTRAVPGMNPMIPGQVAQLPGGPRAVPAIPEPREARVSMPLHIPQPPMARSVPMQVPQAPYQQQHVAASTPVVPLPSLSKWDNAQLDKLVETNMPENVYQNFNGDMRATGQGNPGLAGAGPPPFPLSSMPMNRGRGIQPVGAQARFGSWHGGHENLPQSSFHSYVPVHMAAPMSIKVNHLTTHKTGRQACSIKPKAAHHYTQAAAQSVVKHIKVVEKPEPKAASYPPYRRYVSGF